jgi:uracil-DNA glycosylase
MKFSDHSPPLSELTQRAHIKTVSPLSSWNFLKFWDYYYKEKMNELTDRSILPSIDCRFKALELTPFDKVKCVILGQDPYHTKGMAHGLAFSVLPHVSNLPPSLRNIFKEYQDDLGYPEPRNGDLRTWAERGVLLLNTVLTVEEGKPNSHRGIGWEKLCYEVIRSLDGRVQPVVFMLWGKSAQEYTGAVQKGKVLASVHPSPLSASAGWLGSKPFTRCNEALKQLDVEPIDWRLA